MMISIKRGRERITKSNKERLEDSRFILVGRKRKLNFGYVEILVMSSIVINDLLLDSYIFFFYLLLLFCQV